MASTEQGEAERRPQTWSAAEALDFNLILMKDRPSGRGLLADERLTL